MMINAFGLPTPPLPRLQPRAVDAHKGTFGHALVVGGSRGMAGSISLTTSAALRAGAGLVSQAIPDKILDTVAVLNPSAMSLALKNDEQGRITASAYEQVAARYEKTTCIACGPGLGRSSDLQTFVRRLVVECPLPCVIDADALNNIADAGAWPATCAAARVLTPHPGEWSRISGIRAADVQAQQAAAVEFARNHDVTMVLKGHRTLVTDGNSVYINDTGTPAMASGGSGDVLTGIIAALICQGLSPREAAQLSVHAHGLAGQLAQRAKASRVVLATELVDFIDAALVACL